MTREGEWSLSHYYANFELDAIPMRRANRVYMDLLYCYADKHPRLFIKKLCVMLLLDVFM